MLIYIELCSHSDIVPVLQGEDGKLSEAGDVPCQGEANMVEVRSRQNFCEFFFNK